MDACLALVLLDELSLREGVRLSSTNREMRQSIYTAILEYVGRFKITCLWRRGVRVSSYVKSQTMNTRVAFAKATSHQRGSYMYHPQLPSRSRVQNHLEQILCRECLSPTNSLARARSGHIVRVCKTCSMVSCSFSYLCDRSTARERLRGCVQNVETVMGRLAIARRGGNRAHLFWAYQIDEMIHGEKVSEDTKK